MIRICFRDINSITDSRNGFYLLIIISLIGINGYSQPKMNFESKAHNFGTIKEADGRKTYTFNLTNTGDQALVIQNIVPSCGCTTPEWTRSPIPPNGKGTITAIYDPAGSGGAFSKTLTVYSNAKPVTQILTLEGEVIPKEKGVEDLYLWPVGTVRFANRGIIFPSVVKTQKRIRVLQVINPSGSPALIEFTGVPSHLQMKMVPETLKPGQKGLLECTYFGTKDNRWGNVTDTVKVKINGVIQEPGLYVSANLVEDFSVLSREEIANAPLLVALSNRYEIGSMLQDSEKPAEFSLRNDGKRDLIIREVRPSCDCARVTRGSGLTIKPGETGKIVISFNPGKLTGSITRSVYIYSNDPKNSQVILLIHADVKPSSPSKM